MDEPPPAGITPNVPPTIPPKVDIQRALDDEPLFDDKSLPDDAALARFAAAAIESEARSPHSPASLTLRLVGEEEGAVLNADYRGRDGATNVLSFPFERPPGLPEDAHPGLLGDVVLCLALAKREADTQGKSLEAHLAHLIVHGVLHLQGHDHQQDEAAQVMESAERDVLARLGFADPYAGEAR